MAIPLPQIVLFGDSLFEGAADTLDGFCLQAAIQNFVRRRLDVVNRGLSGYNTSNALKHLPEVFSPPSEGGPKLQYLFILLGANDACIPGMPTNKQHVPLKTYKENLAKIINHPSIASHKPKVFLITPPPLDEIRITALDLAWGHKAATRQSKVSASYSEAARQVAAELPGVTLIDLWKALMDVAIAQTPGYDPSGPLLGDPEGGQRGHLEYLLPDGLHMSGESYRVLWHLVKPHLGEEWRGTKDEDHVGFVLPYWDQAQWIESVEERAAWHQVN